MNLSPFTVIVTSILDIGFPCSSTSFPVIVTLSPTLTSGIGFTVIVDPSSLASKLSLTGSTLITSLPIVAVTLFSPATTLSTSTWQFPFSSVVVVYVLPFTVTLTGMFGTGFLSLSVTVPLIVVVLPTNASTGRSTVNVPLFLITFTVLFAFALLYNSFPRYSAVTGFLPTLFVGNVAW